MGYPRIILLNGASSSGKTTLSKELIKHLNQPYFYYSSDQLVDSGMLPQVDRENYNTTWSWNILRPVFFKGFQNSIKSFADAGLYLLVEHIVEKAEWFDELVDVLSPFSVFYIGVTCPVEEIDKRELKRGNRKIGEGRSHLDDGIHTWSEYDLTIDTFAESMENNVNLILKSISEFNPSTSVFSKQYKLKNQR